MAICGLFAVAGWTLAVVAPNSVNAAEHAACDSSRQQTLINIWKERNPFFVEEDDKQTKRETFILLSGTVTIIRLTFRETKYADGGLLLSIAAFKVSITFVQVEMVGNLQHQKSHSHCPKLRSQSFASPFRKIPHSIVLMLRYFL